MHLKISVLGRSHKQQENGNCLVEIMQHKLLLHDGLMLPYPLTSYTVSDPRLALIFILSYVSRPSKSHLILHVLTDMQSNYHQATN